MSRWRPYPGTAAHFVASGDGRLDIDADPQYRYAQFSTGLLLALMTLWANVHGSFTFGLAMIAPIACDALWRASHSERPSVIRQWALFAVLAFGAACLNPYGPEMIMVTFRTVALGAALSTVTEWRPQDFGHVGSFEIILLAAFGIALYRGVRLPLLRIVMLFGVLHLSLSQARHANLLGMLAPIFLARPLAEQFAARALGHGPGSYLDFVGIPPFIDGRAEHSGEAYTLRHDRALSLQNLPDFLRLLDEFRISVTLLIPSTPAVALLDCLPDWKRVYADDVAVVHMRRVALPSH